MIWALLRKVPKYALVLLVLIGSTVGFFIWKATYRARHVLDTLNQPGVVKDNGPKVAKVEAGHEHMVLVDNDLYDVESGELVFSNWLSKGMPIRISWEPDTKTVLADYERGFVRYGLDGKEVAMAVDRNPIGISYDRKWIVFARDRDLWRADVNWRELKFENERKLTSIAQFNDANFIGNIMAGTDKMLVVRNMNQLLQVNLETGDVHPMKLSLGDIGKRRSPSGRYVVGLQNAQFYCYDVDTNQTATVNLGRVAINDFQWLDEDKCAVILSGKQAALYDRNQNTLKEIVELPNQCSKVGEPSPGGLFVFCYGWKGGSLVDLEKKTATPLTGEATVAWVSKDSFLFAREVPDSSLRGTWLKSAGEDERRVSPELFVVSNTGPLMATLKSKGVIVLATKQGLVRMKSDGTELTEFAKRSSVPQRILAIEDPTGAVPHP